jgi:hypothetical protein
MYVARTAPLVVAKEPKDDTGCRRQGFQPALSPVVASATPTLRRSDLRTPQPRLGRLARELLLRSTQLLRRAGPRGPRLILAMCPSIRSSRLSRVPASPTRGCSQLWAPHHGRTSSHPSSQRRPTSTGR